MKPWEGNDHFGFFHTELIIYSRAGCVQRYSTSNSLANAITSFYLCPKWRSQLQHCSSTWTCPAEGDRAGRSPGPCSLVPEHLLHRWPQFYTSSFRHFAKQLFKQKPAVSHLDYGGGGRSWAAYRNTTQRLPFSNNFHTLSAPKETVREQKPGRRQMRH